MMSIHISKVSVITEIMEEKVRNFGYNRKICSNTRPAVSVGGRKPLPFKKKGLPLRGKTMPVLTP